jgi:hypothetical protein
LNGSSLSGNANLILAAGRTATLNLSSTSNYSGVISGTGSHLISRAVAAKGYTCVHEPFEDWSKYQDYEQFIETVVAPTDTEKLNAIKFKAQGLLNNSDFVMLSDVQLTNKAAWETYRASLRTIRSNPTLTAVFPTIPDLDWAT